MLTTEYLKIFLLTGVITASAIGIAFSSGQFDTMVLDYRVQVHTEYLLNNNTDNIGHIWYEIYNTGTSDIDIIRTSCEITCNINDPALVHPLGVPCDNCTPPRSGGESLLSGQSIKINGRIVLGSLERGDHITLQFDAIDALGSNKLVIKQVLVR